MVEFVPADALTAAQAEIERLKRGYEFAATEMDTAAHVMSHYGPDSVVKAYQDAAQTIRDVLQGGKG